MNTKNKEWLIIMIKDKIENAEWLLKMKKDELEQHIAHTLAHIEGRGKRYETLTELIIKQREDNLKYWETKLKEIENE